MANQPPEPIAVVGMACRLPGSVSTPGDFYRMLCRKRTGWSKIPQERFSAEAYHHPNPDKKGCFNSRGGYFIKGDISKFDAAFFDITKKEAESMDPAQRLLLECAYEAFENAGMPKESISGKNIGVFMGGNYNEHRVGNLRDLDQIPSFDATGNQAAFLAGRLAYYFNLKGPAFTVDTACSSSMHAIHLAVQSIRAGESEQAIVGASHLITHPDIWVSMGMLHLFSDAGRTHAFDSRAKSGYARGEGAGCLVLKPLAQAQADNDHIFSVITHTGINHNGRTVGIVAPSQKEQANLLKKVFAEANINPSDVGFFEAHGTGTKKGDPVEAGAIYEAVGKHMTPDDPVYIGSAKTNVGHLESASGVVSVIKAVLMLYYGFILPHADFKRANRAIPLETWNMRVATEQKPWPAKRKYVCVNNFGFSGSNSTCVLSAAPQIRGLEVADSGCYSPLRLFVVSANDEYALRKSVNRLGIWIEQHAELYQTTMPRNLAYTLCQRRSHFPWRVAVVAGMCSDVASALNRHDVSVGRASTEPPRLAFVYTGQGAQWHAMGRELLRTHPVFFEAILRADQALQAIGADFSVLEELRRDKASSRVGLAHISQPLCSAIQLALTDLFASFGVRPAAVTGHSSGEIAAAYAAGALTFESAIAAAYHRGQVIVELKETQPQLRGTMMAAGAGAEELAPMLRAVNKKGGPQVVVACENSPSSSTLSGDEAAIEQIGKVLEEKGIFNRRLFVDVAYHSPHMKYIAESYLSSVRHIEAPAELTCSEVDFFSSLHGRKISLAELGPQYWVDNLTQPVRFATSLHCLFTEHRPDILLEIGPHAALKGPIMQALKKLGRAATKISYIPALVRNQDATRTCLEAAGELFVRGCPLNFFEVNHNREEYEKPELVPSLYTYPWSRQKYWDESRLSLQHRIKPFARHDLLGGLADWSNDLEPTWRNVVRIGDLPWLKDYQVRSLIVFPVSCFISMVVEAAAQKALQNNLDVDEFEIKDFQVLGHIFMQDGQDVEILVSFRSPNLGQKRCYAFSIFSHESTRGWQGHCTGTVTATPASRSRRASSSRPGPSLHRQTTGAPAGAVPNGVAFEETSVHGETTSDSASTGSKMSSEPGSEDDDEETSGFIECSSQWCEGPVSETRRLFSSRRDIYRQFASRGVSYPSSFQSVTCAAAEGTHMTAQCTVKDTVAEMPFKHESPYQLHPSVVDAIFQIPLLGLATTEGDEETKAPHLPYSIRYMTVPARWSQKAGDKLAISAKLDPTSANSMVELFPDDFSAPPAMSIAGLKFKPLGQAKQAVAAPRELCFTLNWEPLKEAELNGSASTPVVKAQAGVMIVTRGDEGSKDPLIAALSQEIKARTGAAPGVCPIDVLDDWNSNLLVLAELWRPMLCFVSARQLEKVKKMLTEAPGLMWVTRGATHSPTVPPANMALGLIRTARSERNATASTLDLDPRSELGVAAHAALIADAFSVSVLDDNEPAEMEFAENGGRLVVPRISPDEKLNLEVHRSLGLSAPYRQNFHQRGRRLRLASRVNPDPDSDDGLYFEDAQDTPLADDEVEIAVVASTLSHDDIITDTADKTAIIPRSCSGRITRVGQDVRHLERGVMVCALAEGPFGTHARAKATSVAPKPPSLAPEAAACLPGPMLAAYYALHKVANVRPGERVLVQLTGPAGVAAVEVGRYLGAILYAMVQNDEQFNAAQRAGVPPERILDARSIYLRRELEEATQGEGMAVVLALSGYETLRSWECLANFGRFVEIRTPGDHEKTRPELGVNATFSSVNMISIAAERPQAMEQSLRELIAKIESGVIAPPAAATEVPVSKLHSAIRMVREGAVESVVTCANIEEQVQATHRVPKSTFRGDGVHLIVGGTGGLGRSMAKHMIEHGARHIMLVSRSGGSSDAIQQLQQEARRYGAHVTVMRCDVSDFVQAEQLVEMCKAGSHPVCGVIHAAMVLRDALLESMTHDDYQQVTEPKVRGAWNLHKALRDNGVALDYFVALSSASGILGSRGQGAYAAANTFLDSLVQYRVANGLPGTSLDLTAVTGAGYLAENEQRKDDIVRNFGNETVNEEEVLALLSAAVRGMCGPQCLTGMKLHLSRDGQWPYYANDARFVDLKAECLAEAEREGLVPKPAVSPGNAFRAAKSDEEAASIAAQGVVEKLSEVLTIAVEDVDVGRNITSFGLDSLTAIELRNWIAKELWANLQILELLSSGTINDLAALIVQKTRGAKA